MLQNKKTLKNAFFIKHKKRKKTFFLHLCVVALTCDVDQSSRNLCGCDTISLGQCRQKGCCWDDASDPKCFQKISLRKYRCPLGDSPLSQMAAIAMQCINFCILALGSGQRLIYRFIRLGSGLGLVLVLVCAYCSACADLTDSGALR